MFNRGAVTIKFKSDIQALQSGLRKASGDIGNFVNKNSKSLDKFEASQRKLNNTLRDLASRKNLVNQRLRIASQRYQETTQRTKEMNYEKAELMKKMQESIQKHGANSLKLREQAEELAKVNDRLKKATEQQAKSKVQVQTLTNAQANLNSRYDETDEKLKKLGDGPSRFQKLKDSMKSMNDQAGGIPAKIGNIVVSLGKMAVAAGIAGVALGGMAVVGFGFQAIKTMATFETQMSKLRSIAGATGEQFNLLKAQAKDLGRTTEWSASQVADAQIQLAKTGLDSAEILKSTAPMLQLATVGQLDLGRAADLATNTMTQFNLEADEMGRVSGVMALTANKSAQTVEDLAEGFSYLAPIASNLNMSIEQTASITAGLADAGLKGSRGNRVLATSLQRLARPTQAMRGSMNDLNVQFFDGQGQFRNFADIIGELQGKMGGLTQEQQMYHISTLFGAEATGSWLKLIESGADPLRALEVELGNSEEALKRLAFEALGPTERAMFTLQSAYEGVLLSFSEAGLLEMVASLMTKIANVMVRLAEKIETVVAPKMRDFMEYLRSWYNNGGRDAIVRFVQTGWNIFERAVIMFINEYWPRIRNALKNFAEWFNSEEGQKDIENWVSMFERFGSFVLGTADAFFKLVDALLQVKNAWDGLPQGMKDTLVNGAMSATPVTGTISNINRLRGLIGRSVGGPVEGGQMYQVGERNMPEILESGGRQFMIPGDKGRVLREGQVDKPQKKQVQKVVNINNYNTSPDQVFVSNSLLFA